MHLCGYSRSCSVGRFEWLINSLCVIPLEGLVRIQHALECLNYGGQNRENNGVIEEEALNDTKIS